MKGFTSTMWRATALLLTLVCLPAVPAAAQGGKWWQSEKFQRELALSEEQISRIEEIFQGALPDFRGQKKALDRLESELSRLINTSADEAAVMAHLDTVEGARAELSKARTLMLLRIRKILTPEQREKLAVLHARDRKKSRDHR